MYGKDMVEEVLIFLSILW